MVRSKAGSHTQLTIQLFPGPCLKSAQLQFTRFKCLALHQIRQGWQGKGTSARICKRGLYWSHTSLVLTAMAFSLRTSKLRPPFILTQTSVVSCVHTSRCIQRTGNLRVGAHRASVLQGTNPKRSQHVPLVAPGSIEQLCWLSHACMCVSVCVYTYYIVCLSMIVHNSLKSQLAGAQGYELHACSFC